MTRLIILFILFAQIVHAQSGQIKGLVISEKTKEPLSFVALGLKGSSLGTSTDLEGTFSLKGLSFGNYELKVQLLGYEPKLIPFSINEKTSEIFLNIYLAEHQERVEEVVVSATMKETSKSKSPIPVEVYTAKFFKANPNPSLFESMQNINGVRPQLNCNVCNTGDIHINGLEGPYTMVLIDGMPIVSGLSTVYGLTGIPQALIERVEVVKGPASTLYGSEAVGGLVNIITKSPQTAPRFSADVMATSWAELNADLGFQFNIGKKAESLLGVNYFNYQLPLDKNGDGFTDVTLQNRLSIFNKWTFKRKDQKQTSMAGRLLLEDRWGGEMNWTPEFRGGDSIYGESIHTKRWELFGLYQLPTQEQFSLQWSANGHQQNSVYGDMAYIADQYVAFGQLLWTKTLGKHDLLSGASFRFTYYDDNTIATEIVDEFDNRQNNASLTYLPGIYLQDDWSISPNHTLLSGLRYDYNSLHGSILTPRVYYKWNSDNQRNILRIGAGNGYRVANVFTEDHAALTGARTLVFANALKPETSWNANLNFVKKFFTKNNAYIGIDASAFYTYFTNKIVADYATDPNKIIYDNLSGHAISRGGSVNLDMSFDFGLTALVGFTAMDVYSVEGGVRERQMLTENYSGTWSIAYTHPKTNLRIDYTGNLYGPMRLPILGALDPRPAYSPWWSLQNIQLTKTFKKGWELYGGVKNLLNYTPPANSIARSFDPFDKQVVFDVNGQVVATPDNPNALSFDPAYMFAPNQGIRLFLGLRCSL